MMMEKKENIVLTKKTNEATYKITEDGIKVTKKNGKINIYTWENLDFIFCEE